MPSKRTRTGRGSRLCIADHAALTVGTSANWWSAAERERLRALWDQHGDRLTREAWQRDAPEPWAAKEFGPPPGETAVTE